MTHAEAAHLTPRASMDGLWIALADADAEREAERLAAIAWDLYARLGEATAHEARLRAAIRDLACKASAAAPPRPACP